MGIKTSLKTPALRNDFVGTVFMRMYFFSIFSAFVMFHPYLYLYLVCFTFECIMAIVQMFFVNIYVIEFAKKKNKIK